MEQFLTFHQTVQGYSHIVRNIVCEDSSGSCTDPGKDLSIAVVADGHGEDACVRSALGSRFAVDSVIQCMKEFAELARVEDEVHKQPPILEQLCIPSRENRAVKQLSDSIFSRWSRMVQEHYSENPLTEEEYETGGEYVKDLSSTHRIEHLYGTTFIAGIRIGTVYLLLQQGDGRCVVFYEDGSADMPIPWDERCYANVTTSVSDEDASSSVRHVVLCDEKRRPIACFFGSDGIEDSFSSTSGTYDYYRRLMIDIMKFRNTEEIEEHLRKTLPDISKFGSGDDTSVAGIVDAEAIQPFQERFLEEMLEHATAEKLETLKQKQISMQRKDRFLEAQLAKEKNQIAGYQKNIKNQTKHLNKATGKKYKRQEKWRELEEQIERLEKEQEDAKKKLTSRKQTLEQYLSVNEELQSTLMIQKLNQDVASAERDKLQNELERIQKERTYFEKNKAEVQNKIRIKTMSDMRIHKEMRDMGIDLEEGDLQNMDPVDDDNYQLLQELDERIEANKSREIECGTKLKKCLNECSDIEEKLNKLTVKGQMLETKITIFQQEIRKKEASLEQTEAEIQKNRSYQAAIDEEVHTIDKTIAELRESLMENKKQMEAQTKGDSQAEREYNEYHLKYTDILNEIQELEN